MIEPRDFLASVIDPALDALTAIAGRDMGGDRARCLMLAIALQESALAHRRQVGPDGAPLETLARGWWQFEKGGGVKGVLTHKSSKDMAASVCAALEIEPVGPDTVHEALAWHDHLSAAFARLLLWTDPRPLPAVGDEDGAWDMYLDNWRPGKPHRDRWSTSYRLATEAVSPPVPATKPAAPKTERGILRVEGSKPVEVALPTMARSWQTGEFWLTVVANVGTVLVFLSPIYDPFMAQIAENPALASIPLATAAVNGFRTWYKRERTRMAAEIAAKGEQA